MDNNLPAATASPQPCEYKPEFAVRVDTQEHMTCIQYIQISPSRNDEPDSGYRYIDRYTGPMLQISHDETWLYLETASSDGTAMVNIETLDAVIEELNRIRRRLKQAESAQMPNEGNLPAATASLQPCVMPHEMEERIAEIEAREKAATPGPWEQIEQHGQDCVWLDVCVADERGNEVACGDVLPRLLRKAALRAKAALFAAREDVFRDGRVSERSQAEGKSAIDDLYAALEVVETPQGERPRPAAGKD